MVMYRILLHIVLLRCIFTSDISPLTVDYYQALIEENKAQAENFKLPKNNAEFQQGLDSTETLDFGSFDFIIVGAGTAGSVLATRLSEIESWEILLLEAGSEESDFSKIPAMAGLLPFSEMNWGYYTTPQTHCCLGMKERKCNALRGKAIGGSTAINMMVYNRGNRNDFNEWVRLGNSGWSYEEVLPYFIKSENSQIDGDPGYHGVGGLWNLEYSLPLAPLFSTFVEANSHFIPFINDYNGEGQIGVSKFQQYIKRGRRQSTGTAFLSSARKRKSLKVVTKALVTKIVIDENTKTAEGVIFVTKDKKYSASARKEVIVSGGAYNSPQLLMLSGIGPQEHLSKLGIDVIENLPVGQSLAEHVEFFGITVRTNVSVSYSVTQSSVSDYIKGYGPLTTIPLGDVHAYTNAGDVPESVPMLHYFYYHNGINMAGDKGSEIYNFNEEITNAYLKKKDPTTDVDLPIMIMHPKSRGNVTLQSNNPIDFPNINGNALSDPEDIENLLIGIEFILKLIETEDFRKVNATLLDIPICPEFEKLSREYWVCVLRQMATSMYHPTVTTPMGPDPTTSVVSSELKVHGIDKLRVVDAGVIPSTTSGAISAIIVMIAEKISDVIKNDYDF